MTTTPWTIIQSTVSYHDTISVSIQSHGPHRTTSKNSGTFNSVFFSLSMTTVCSVDPILQFCALRLLLPEASFDRCAPRMHCDTSTRAQYSWLSSPPPPPPPYLWSNRGSYAYQPNAFPLDQAGSPTNHPSHFGTTSGAEILTEETASNAYVPTKETLIWWCSLPIITAVKKFNQPSVGTLLTMSHHYHHHHHHLSLNREGRWGTKDDFATSFLHLSQFSTALWDLANSRPGRSPMLSSHLFPPLLDIVT